MDTLFTITALIGGVVLAFQFLMVLVGFGGDHAAWTTSTA